MKILSDLMSVVIALEGFQADTSLVRDKMSLLRDISLVNDVKLCWVKGRSDNTGNELADMLANKGRAPPLWIVSRDPPMSLIFTPRFLPFQSNQNR